MKEFNDQSYDTCSKAVLRFELTIQYNATATGQAAIGEKFVDIFDNLSTNQLLVRMYSDI